MESWTIGAVRVTSLLESLQAVPATGVIEAMTPEAVAPHLGWLQPDYVTEDLLVRIAIQSMLVESGGTRILVDTCFGNDRTLPYPGMPVFHTDFLERLHAAGFGPDHVDVVVCTHLHFDHVGWNTRLVDGRWVPTFPNAQYLFGRQEYEHWQDHEDFHIDLTDNVEPVVAAGLHRLVEPDHQMTPEVRLVPTPGHTPGHVSVRIDSEGASALIGGDMLHHPAQVVEQGWASAPDYDKEQAVATRRRVLTSLADTNTLFIGTHFAAPAAGHVRGDDQRGWSWSPLRQQQPVAGSLGEKSANDWA